MRSGLAPLLVGLLAVLPGCAIGGLATPAGLASEPATPSLSPSPSASSSPTPSASPSPSPTPTPDVGAMTLSASSCNGGVSLRWSPSMHPDFHHYIGLRSPEDDIEPAYPPIAPAVDWGDLYATDRFVTSGYDATVVPSSTRWQYRVMAYDAQGRVVSRSEVASARILPHRSLGSLEAEVLEDGRVRLSWRRFDGVPDCFSAYRVLHGTGGVAGTLLGSISDRSHTEMETDVLRPGSTYALRVQAVHTTGLGHFVLAESDPLTLTPVEP